MTDVADARDDGTIDPDVDLSVAAQVEEVRPREWDLLAVIAVGGVLGAEARYGVGRLVTHSATALPWSTILINVTGSLLLGVLMGVIETRGAHRLLRPFVGVGILGGYTTFSTFAVDTDRLLHAHRVAVACGYLATTVLACLAAVTAGFQLARRIAGGPR